MKLLRLVPVALLLFAVACGGGGGSETAGESFAGVWRGTLDLADNTCGGPFDSRISTELTVNQDGRKVVVDSSSGSTYEGFADVATLAATKSVPATECNGEVTTTIILLRGEGDDYKSDEALLGLSVKSSCSECQVTYAGIGRRTVK